MKKKKSNGYQQVRAFNIKDDVIVEQEIFNGIMFSKRLSIDQANEKLNGIRSYLNHAIAAIQFAIDKAVVYRNRMVCSQCGATFGHHKLIGENCPSRTGRVKCRWRKTRFKRTEK